MAQVPSGAGEGRVVQYIATAGQTVFIYNFKVYADKELTVQYDNATLILTTDYTVQDAGEEAGGTITLVTGAVVDAVITLTGNTIIDRDSVFTNGGDYLAEAINGEYDKLDDITKEMVTDQNGNFRFEVYNPTASTTIPNPESRRGLVWNTEATDLVNTLYDPDDSGGSAAAAAQSAAEALASQIAAAQSAAEALASEIAAAQSALDAANSAASIDLGAVDEDLLPKTDSLWDVGSTTKRWAEIHGDDGIFEGDVSAATFNGSPLHTTPLVAMYSNDEDNKDTGGGSYATPTVATRPLNTELVDEIGITLSGDALTVPAGSYKVDILVSCAYTFATQITLYDTTNSTELARTYKYMEAYDSITCFTVFTLASPAVLEIQMYATTSRADDAMGQESGTDDIKNRYALIRLEKY
jgi:hypothetical protein